MINLLKQFAIVSFVVIILTVLGNAINDLITWDFLVTIFAVLRKVLDPMDFLINTDLLMQYIGYSISVYMAYWVGRGGILVKHIFN